MIARLDSDSPRFLSALQSLGEFPEQDQIQIRASVADILEDVRVRGDEALVELTNRFDGRVRFGYGCAFNRARSVAGSL